MFGILFIVFAVAIAACVCLGWVSMFGNTTPTFVAMRAMGTGPVTINKTLDVIDRTFWTFLNTFLGLLTVDALTAMNTSTGHELLVAAVAAAYTTLKALAAQHVGNSPIGDAIPGGSVVQGQTTNT